MRQGDVISPLLFNAVLEMTSLDGERKLENHGWVSDKENEPLTRVRFTDDVLLYASLKMLEPPVAELNADKTEISTTK